jgi:hypothetical protein
LAVFGFLDLGLDPDPLNQMNPDTENWLEEVQIAVRISYVRMIELREKCGLSLKISQHIVGCLLLDRKNSKVKKRKNLERVVLPNAHPDAKNY